MFSLYHSKMSINLDCDNIDDNYENVLSTELLYMMNHFQEYLDNDWYIKKRNSCYILIKNKKKIIVPDSIYLSDKINKNKNKNLYFNEKTTEEYDDLTEHGSTSKNTTYLLYLMYNVLNNGWTVKKSGKLNEKYAFIKNHEGKKEYFSNNYIHTFMKENFNFKLIK